MTLDEGAIALELATSGIDIDDVPTPPATPVRDEASARVLEEAVVSLVLMRFPLSLYDATADLHALASLAAEAERAIPAHVVDARAQGHSWEEIAICLGIAPATARRYATRARKEQPLD